MPHAPSPTAATASARIRSALEERAHEVSAGRWLAFGTLLLFGAGFAAIAGIVGASLDVTSSLGPTGHRLATLATFALLCAALAAVGWRLGSAERGSPAAWVAHPARVFLRAVHLAIEGSPKPSPATLREAATILDAADEPALVARRIAAGGDTAMRALELLESLGLLRARSLRRTLRSKASPAAAAPAPDLSVAAGSHAAPVRPLTRVREVHGLRERWRSSCGAGTMDLHAAALAGWVLARDESQLTSIAADGSHRWSRPLAKNVTGIHVSCDGARVACLGERGVVTLLAGESGERLAQLAAGDAATAVAVTAGGARVWIGDRFGLLRIFDARARLVREIRVGHPIDFLAVASEVELGVVASRRGHLSSVDPARGETRRTFIRSDLRRVWIEEDGERALLVAPAEGVLAWDFGMGSMDTYAIDRAVRDAASDAPGDRLVALTFDARLVLLDGGARVLWQCDAPPGTESIRMSGDGARVWCADGAGSVRQLEVIDRSDAERPVLDFGASQPPPSHADPDEPRVVPEPDPGGFRRLLIDPRGTRIVLIHPDGRVAVQRDAGSAWLVTAPGGAGTGDAVFTGDGSAVGLVLDRGVRRIETRDGRVRDLAMPSPRIAAVASGGEIVAATPNGELWSIAADHEVRITSGLEGLTNLATSPGDGHPWVLWWSRGDGGVSRLDPRTAGSAEIVPARELAPPVRLVATRDRVLVVDATGHLRWLTADGRETARAALALPIVHLELAGDRAAALTDFLGNVHLVTPDGGTVAMLPRPDGILRAGVDTRGEPWLLRVHRQLLLCQSWDGSIRARARIPGTPLDLADGPAGAWGVLTTAGLFSSVAAAAPSSDRARFLEL